MLLPHPLVALVPIVCLVGMIFVAVTFFGADAMSGSSQVCMLCAAAISAALSMLFCKGSWQVIERGIIRTIGDTSTSILILLLIGMISGTWMISGVVPTLIYYGIQIISPQFYLVSACIICAVVSLMTGSSWTTIATIGIALLGVGKALGVSEAWAAGAIISGAYFGDKISPLSDTTVLASSSANVGLFDHIRYMLFTTTPSMLITLVIFLVSGLCTSYGHDIVVDDYLAGLDSAFHISPWTLVVPVLTGLLIARKVPAVITLFAASVFAAVCAMVLQPDILCLVAQGDGNIFRGLFITCFGHTAIDTGNASLNDLVSTSGMAGMLNTVWLIICALTFGGVMMSTRMIESITTMIIRLIRGRVSLVSSTVVTGIFSNLATSDQYISIILSASMFKDVYRRLGYENRLLSRTTEDAVTVTSVLVPWNTCGLTQATVLGVATITYLPYCFFNLISPLMSILIALTGWKIPKKILTPNPL